MKFPPKMFCGVALLLCSLWSVALAADPPSILMKPGREFAADSYVHKPLAPDAPIDPNSDRYVADLNRQIKQFYGHATVNIHNFSPPVFIVGPDQPTVRVIARDPKKPEWKEPRLQAQFEAVPLPDDFKSSPGTDKEAVVYQPSTGKYWEFWLMEKTGEKTKDSAGREVDQWGRAGAGRSMIFRRTPAISCPMRRDTSSARRPPASACWRG